MHSICFVGLDNYPVLNGAYGSGYFGGESVQQTLLAKAFADLGYAVSMIVGDHGQPDEELIDGIRVLKAYEPTAGLPVVRFVHPRITKIWDCLTRSDADIYYQSCAGMLTGLTAWFCRRKGRTFVFRLAHDTDCIPGQQLIRLWRDRKIYEYGLKRADVVFAQSLQQETLLETHYKMSSVVLGMATELPDKQSAALRRDIDVLWVNNLRQFKRPDIVPQLAKRLPNVRIVMIGGPVAGHEELYEQTVAEAAGLPNLEFLGAVPYSDVNQYFSRASVFINTSDQEGFPNSFLQAWIRGVPVISFFDPDGIIQREDLGRSPDNFEEFALSVSSLLEDPAKLRQLSERCHKFGEEHYSPRSVARQYARYFHKSSDGNGI